MITALNRDKLRVALLYGGSSEEKEVSCQSAQEVFTALTSLTYKVKKIFVSKNLPAKLKEFKPDVAFIAMHGGSGEDGTLQALLDSLAIPYTGSGVLASSIAMHKTMAKRLFLANNILTPPFLTMRKGASHDISADVRRSIGFPVVVKPASQGSTIGLSIVEKEENLDRALKLAFKYDDQLLIEQFSKGVEITVGVLGNNKLKTLPAIEIITQTGFYDYKTKYTAGLSSHIIPARISNKQRIEAERAAISAHKALGCRGFSRADFICPQGQSPQMLEVNTIPGLTKLSLFPDAAKAAGIDFNNLVEQLVGLAMED